MQLRLLKTSQLRMTLGGYGCGLVSHNTDSDAFGWLSKLRGLKLGYCLKWNLVDENETVA